MPKMHQVISIESGTKTRVMRDLTAIYHNLQHAPGFAGLTKTYEPTDEEGVQFPDEGQLVQQEVETLLQQVAETVTELFDVVATKDRGNCEARADVVVDDKPLLKDVPATHLLFLEKQLKDIQTVVDKIPTLDPAYEWKKDEAGGYRSNAVTTTKTQKVPEVIQVAKATEHHPEQAQLINVDRLAGHWTTTKLSGAISADRKKQLRGRIATLINAVKFAREAANNTEIDRREVGTTIFGYLFN
ncbi:hypothetical protein LCGC14_0828030 [marine sediment metagenome]|uniref:Uncharacterized protein n=1 Tax=marine sediment metagenome TaxID=412755 RepID=A0A0F9Q222_9ZZZZ